MAFTLQQQLVTLLVQHENFQSATTYAKELEVSDRTVYVYLDELEPMLASFGCTIEKVQGKGIRLRGKLADKHKALRTFKTQRHPTDLSPIERRQVIFYRLLMGITISYHELAEEYFVSRSSIVTDMKWIKENYFHDNHAASENYLLSTPKGTQIKAEESVIQNLMAKWTFKQFELEYGQNPSELKEYVEFFKRTFQNLDKNQDSDSITLNWRQDQTLDSTTLNQDQDQNSDSTTLIQQVYHEVQRIKKQYALAEYYAIVLFESLSILVMRINKGHHLEKKKRYVFEQVQNLDTYYIAEECAKNLSTVLKNECTVEDILYINECFVANGLKDAQMSIRSSYYSKIVEQLIQKFSAMLNMDLSADEKLRAGLFHHLIPMYFRIQQGISLPNPYIREIKQQYSMMFHLTWFLLIDLEEELNRRIPEDEIGFMMIHFQSALERNRDVKKILIISPLGAVTSELLEMRVKKALPSIHVYEMIAEDELPNVDLKKVDLILSTVSLEEKETKVIEMTTIPSEEELRTISQYITEQFSERKSFQLGDAMSEESHPLLFYLENAFIQLNQTYTSSKEVIRKLVSPLVEKEFVDDNYLQSVLEREKLSTTAFETGVAIPHGNPEYVKQTSISVIVNEKKINWGKEKVDVVILFSIAKKDVPNLRIIMEPIYDVIHSRKRVEEVFKNQRSPEEIISYFTQRKL